MQAMTGKGRITSTAVGVVLVAAMAGGKAQPVSSTSSSESEPPRAVEERMRVAESAVVVKPPGQRIGGLPRASYSLGYGAGVDVVPERLARDSELIVYLGDAPLEVTEVQRLGDVREWTVVVYLDAALTRGDTLFHSALALARSAARLTRLGPVELLVANSEVQQRVAPTRFPQAIEGALADVAMEASRGEIGGILAKLRRDSVLRESRAESSEDELEGAVQELIARQRAALSLAARDRCATDTCLLLLVSEGFSEIPSGPAEPAEASASSAACCAGESRRLARELAASRWVVGVVVVEKRFELNGSPRERPPEARQLDAGIPPENYARNAAMVPSRLSQTISLEKLDLVVRLESEPLKRIVRETGGFLAATASELDASLKALDDRVLVWFRQPEGPPQDALPLRVVFVPRGQDLWAPSWWRARPDGG